MDLNLYLNKASIYIYRQDTGTYLYIDSERVLQGLGFGTLDMCFIFIIPLKTIITPIFMHKIFFSITTSGGRNNKYDETIYCTHTLTHATNIYFLLPNYRIAKLTLILLSPRFNLAATVGSLSTLSCNFISFARSVRKWFTLIIHWYIGNGLVPTTNKFFSFSFLHWPSVICCSIYKRKHYIDILTDLSVV